MRHLRLCPFETTSISVPTRKQHSHCVEAPLEATTAEKKNNWKVSNQSFLVPKRRKKIDFPFLVMFIIVNFNLSQITKEGRVKSIAGSPGVTFHFFFNQYEIEVIFR